MKRNQINSQSLRNNPSSNDINFSPENNKISISLDESIIPQNSPKETIFTSKKKIQKNKIPLTSYHKKNYTKELNYLSPQENFLTMKIGRNPIKEFKEKIEFPEEGNNNIDLVDLSLQFRNNITFEKIIKENELYKQNNNLKYLSEKNPYITLKLIDSCVDLRICTSKYYIGENGIDCSMKNHSNDFISIGRQQINESAIRPNDIMLFPTDPSISRSHFKMFHKELFNEFYKYKINIDLINRISIKSKYSSLPYHIYIQIMHFLKPRRTIRITDNETIYGTYVEIKNISPIQILINFYLSIYNYSILNNQISLVDLFSNDYMKVYKINHSNYNDNYINDNIKSFNNSMLNPIDLLSFLNYLINNSSLLEIKTKIEKFLNLNYNNILINPFSGEYPLNYLFDKNNYLLKEEQVFLTSKISGFIIEQKKPLRIILSNLFTRFYELNFPMTFISTDYLMNGQKLEPHSHMYTVTIEQIKNYTLNDFIIPNIESPSIQLILTEGDPCGIMNRTQIIVLINNNINQNNSSFSIGLQRGFLFGKNKRSCFNYNYMDCHFFIHYSLISNDWYISNVSNLFWNEDNNNEKDNFTLYVCTSLDKKSNNRFKNNDINFIIQNGDRIKISESVLEVEYHNFD